jgi:hypothetical protein
LDPVTVQLLKDLVGVRLDGYVFTQKRSWTHLKEGEPLTLSTVWVRVRTIAASAGVRGFNPRRFRQYFAAEWSLQKRSLELLRRILRHKSLAYTQFYLSKLIFWEDLQSEYERFQDGPFVGGVVPEPRQVGVAEPLLNGICSVCGSLSVCKYADRMPSWATGCRFHVPTIGKSEERSCLKQKS